APRLAGPLRRGGVPVGRPGRLAMESHPLADGLDDRVAVPPAPARADLGRRSREGRGSHVDDLPL
ncbi:MAG: hypothetical protein AVDCRST_MAG53-520, partial [uncultured Solirubrobacteraceae bacterium]